MLYVDNSILSSVQCSTQLALRYIYGYTSLEEKATLKSGSAGHNAIAAWINSKGDKEKALWQYAEDYKEWAEANVPPDDRLSYENTDKILDFWFENNLTQMASEFMFIPQLVEVGFAYPLNDEFMMCGRFDAVVKWKGQLYLWENKFTGYVNDWFKKRLRMSSQLTDYLWAAKHIMKKAALEIKGDADVSPNISGVLVNGVEFRKVPSSDRRCSEHGVKYIECGLYHLAHQLLGPFGRSPDEIAEWEKTAINLAKRYRDILTNYPTIESLPKLRTQGKFFNACTFCFSYDFCAAGRPMNSIDSMLAYEPWSPYDDVVQASQNVYMEGVKVVK